MKTHVLDKENDQKTIRTKSQKECCLFVTHTRVYYNKNMWKMGDVTQASKGRRDIFLGKRMSFTHASLPLCLYYTQLRGVQFMKTFSSYCKSILKHKFKKIMRIIYGEFIL